MIVRLAKAYEHGRNGFVAVAFGNCNRYGALALEAARHARAGLT
jgi:hypothetical protein